MKIKANKTDLIEAIILPQSIADKKSGRISDLLLEATGDGKIYFTGTDLDSFITTWTSASVEEEGKICVNARKLYEVVRELPGEDVELTTSGDKLEIRSEKAKFNLVTSEPEDFPTKPTVDSSNEFEISSETLSSLINSTLFAAATDDVRPILGGILLEKEGDKLIAVATDSHRLSYASEKVEGLENVNYPEKGIILPRKGASELTKLCSRGDKIKLGITENIVVASDGNTEITIRLILGEYPNYRSVIPRDNPTIATVNRDEFAAAVKRVSLISTDKLKGVKLIFTHDELKLISRDELGDAEESIPVTLKGDPIEIGFNARYLLDSMIPFSGDELHFKLRDEMTATLIYESEELDKFVIIMPMNIPW